jgi:assimilatory nitrate reductase catalytic subunit
MSLSDPIMATPPAPERETKSTCPYCGVGCGVIIQTVGDHIVGVKGDPEHPANWGRLCSKGSTLHLTASPMVAAQSRLTQPLMRAARGAPLQATTWNAALDHAATRFADLIQTHGPDAVGFYISGQLLTEDYYVFNKLAKGLIGTNNIDTNSRLCMSSAVAGYKQSLGADAPPACYDDIDAAQCWLVAGSNAAYAHPILFRRLEAAKAAHPERKLIVADPRRTDTALGADLHLPLLPGTDVALFNGLLHIMLWEGWLDQGYIERHTTGFAELKAKVREYAPERVSELCGLKKQDLFTAAQWFAQSPATLSLYCQGLNQSSSGTAKNTALINLHLATGHMGKAGAGPFSLTGQPNAMGGREVGGLANLLSAHRDLSNADHRAEVAALWGVSDVPAKPGLSAVELFEAAADGQVKALWIACTNPMQSMPNLNTVRAALQKAELVILQEAFAHTETMAFADLVLPATPWGEKDGTVTNSERRISRLQAALPPLGEARHDWQIAADFAQILQARLLAAPAPAPAPALTVAPTSAFAPIASRQAGIRFDYPTAESVWLEHRESTRGRDLDITGMSYAQLAARPQQWPMAEGRSEGLTRLYTDGVFPTPSGKARFVSNDYRAAADVRNSHYPFSLTTGRLRDQWHGMSRTGLVGRLFAHAAEPSLDMHPQDIARRGFKVGDLVQVSSKRGSLILPLAADAGVGLGQCFMAMHWGSAYLSGRDVQGQPLLGVNALTTSAYCPDSKQPELKHAAVKVVKADMPWHLFAAAWLPRDSARQTQEALQALLPQFDFALCVPFANSRPLEQALLQAQGVVVRAAAQAEPAAHLLLEIERLLGLNGAGVLRYADPKRAQRRSVLMQADGQHLQALLLGGDAAAQHWLRSLLQTEQVLPGGARHALYPGPNAPKGMGSKAKAVCSCLGVNDLQISQACARAPLEPTERLASVQAALGCGTQCGSCLPELKALIAQSLLTPLLPSDASALEPGSHIEAV